jgi:hypothetical protein
MFVILCSDTIVITTNLLCNIIMLRLKSIVAVLLFLYVLILGGYLLSFFFSFSFFVEWSYPLELAVISLIIYFTRSVFFFPGYLLSVPTSNSAKCLLQSPLVESW